MPVESDWNRFRFDPSPYLLNSDHPAVAFFFRRDVLGEVDQPVSILWNLPEPTWLLRKQQEDGRWRYAAKKPPEENYDLLETFRSLVILHEKCGMTREHSAIERGAEYLFNCQTKEGDFRGLFRNQYVVHYTGTILEILSKVGYAADPRVQRGLDWLLSVRQDDGGWAAPNRTRAMRHLDMITLPEPLKTDPSKPYFHLITGMILRAFAAHPDFRRIPEAQQAGQLLMSRLFKADKYVDRRTPAYWKKTSFPFWFTDIVSALDSLSLLGFSGEEPEIEQALSWLVENQQDLGGFDLGHLRTGKDKHLSQWIMLAVCRIYKRFYSNRLQQRTKE
jgi:hypothetical protein